MHACCKDVLNVSAVEAGLGVSYEKSDLKGQNLVFRSIGQLYGHT